MSLSGGRATCGLEPRITPAMPALPSHVVAINVSGLDSLAHLQRVFPRGTAVMTT